LINYLCRAALEGCVFSKKARLKPCPTFSCHCEVRSAEAILGDHVIGQSALAFGLEMTTFLDVSVRLRPETRLGGWVERRGEDP